MTIVGQQTRQIQVERSTTSNNEVGGPIQTWELFITLYAKVKPNSGDIKYTLEGQVFNYRTDFIIRYSQAAKEINNNFRINYDGNYYKIIQTQEIGYKKGFILTAVAFSDDGSPKT